jgi:hypothetical protein
VQHSAVPELAHTHPRPIHWVATATAVAGAVALLPVLQPASATAAQGTAASAKPSPVATAPSTAGVQFPLSCGPVKALVVKKASGDLDRDGRPETVAVVHCDAPMGTPPDGVYVLTQGAGAQHPRVVATLVDPKDRVTVSDFSVHGAVVSATLLGYSSSAVPSCCPDVKSAVKWQWNGTVFVRTAPQPTEGA